MLHTCANTLLLFLNSGTNKLTEAQKVHMHKYFYWNHADNCLGITDPLRNKLVECKQT